jgi:hypothetical protein
MRRAFFFGQPCSEKRRLATEIGDEPKKKRQGCAYDDAGDDREIKGSPFAAMDDVAGEMAKAEWKLATKKEECTNKDQHSPQDKKRATELAKRIHENDFFENSIPGVEEVRGASGRACVAFDVHEFSALYPTE